MRRVRIANRSTPENEGARRTAVVTLGVFLALISVPGIYQLARGTRASDVRRWGDWLKTDPPADALRKIDADFDARFPLARTLRTAVNTAVPALPSTAGLSGVDEALDGWLFIALDKQVPRAVGFMNPRLPAPTRARLAIVDLKRQLDSLGIHLLVVPLTARSSIYPDKIEAAYSLDRGPDLNADHDAWFAALRDAGVDAIDLTEPLWQARREADADSSRPPPFLPTDSHWSFAAIERCAPLIASHLEPYVRGLPRVTGHVERVAVSRSTDLAPDPVGDETSDGRTTFVTETRGYLIDASGETNVANDPSAPILVIGDSNAAMHADEGSGFPQVLAVATERSVRSMALAGGNATTMRDRLQKPNALANVRVVVFLFTMRHLIAGEWRPLPVPGARSDR